ncbi:MAG TPA: L,D-transpeptidase [Gammaproteobacteria bacterium]|nr:L,D-transpeptidase [Gammaproteobacteria bacterium]
MTFSHQTGRLSQLFMGFITALLLLPFAARAADYEIEIVKSQGILYLKHGDKVEKTFHAAFGYGGKGDKRQVGDHKTPIGVYRIVKVKDSDKFHRFMLLNYPNVKDAYWGLKNGLLTRTEFDAIIDAARAGHPPPQNTPLGGAVGIHGIGEITPDKLTIHENINWTEGCIALTNEQIDELSRYVEIGTKVVINE